MSGDRLQQVWYFYPRSPCGERRLQKIMVPVLLTHFYPRSPCGERRKGRSNLNGIRIFLSTLSLRRATENGPSLQSFNSFLSTLSLRRATSIFYARHGRQPSFLSTLSLRRATVPSTIFSVALVFLSTLSLRRATCYFEIR